ncbi:MAG TPA: MerR family transcriptional regulator [Candidatus Sulfobium mesophilum]|jgi:MerR family transcriptional regulator/heat shock protein HspR|uniref:Transcriptional regulator n=1 Tax=Candidatus Sulfobium mesophilum TaxID=2016548 RepID=A0A2U3QL62_9BACT|nr:Transcriptional regulator [Candidatus Sulfobium mesophilum]HSB32009.1 MerR family transcriptional regulator [Candidatus Sulfobium mesophilum]
MDKKTSTRPLYLISVVSEMLRVHPQTLRLYEKEGLITPRRTGRQRLYSENDVERLNFILQLTRELGVNKAGVDIILRMRRRMEVMQEEMEEMMGQLEEEIRREFREKLKKALRED